MKKNKWLDTMHNFSLYVVTHKYNHSQNGDLDSWLIY